MNTKTLNGSYFNGMDSRKLEVCLELDSNGLTILYQGERLKSYSLQEFKVHPPLASSSRAIEFTDGARFESFDYSQFETLFPSAKHQNWVFQMETRWVYVLAATLIGVSLILFLHFFILPWSAQYLAMQAPSSVQQGLENSSKKTLQLGWKLRFIPVDEQKYPKANQVIETVQTAYPELNIRVDMIAPNPLIKSANAFALPAGQVLVNQELLDLISPEELHAILLHEVGHIYHRHSLQSLIKSSGVYIIFSLAFGVADFGSLALTLINAAYSRNDEREADDFSAKALAELGLNPMLLAEGLNKMEEAAKKHLKVNSAALEGLLSTHPLTTERTERLKKHATEHGFPTQTP